MHMNTCIHVRIHITTRDGTPELEELRIRMTRYHIAAEYAMQQRTSYMHMRTKIVHMHGHVFIIIDVKRVYVCIHTIWWLIQLSLNLLDS